MTESTTIPSKIMFTKEMEKDVNKYIKMQIDNSHYLPTNPMLLDLNRVKSANLKIMEDDEVLLENIESGKKNVNYETKLKEKQTKLQEELISNHIYV